MLNITAAFVEAYCIVIIAEFVIRKFMELDPLFPFVHFEIEDRKDWNHYLKSISLLAVPCAMILYFKKELGFKGLSHYLTF